MPRCFLIGGTVDASLIKIITDRAAQEGAAAQPSIPLCDKAASTLDSKTTQSSLLLLKRVGREMGVTVLLITHQIQTIVDAYHSDEFKAYPEQNNDGLWWIPKELR